MDVSVEMATLKTAMINDPDYAHSWFCNLKMSFVDAGCENKIAEAGAERFMQLAFEVRPEHYRRKQS